VWSKELTELSKAYLELSGTCVKNLNGDFGVLDIDHKTNTYKVLSRDEAGKSMEYKSADELIKAGWAVD
jgi:asparagine synthetase B (glutamine-hydrolysing)